MSRNDIRLERAWGIPGTNQASKTGERHKGHWPMNQLEARLRVRAAFTEARILKQGHRGQT